MKKKKLLTLAISVSVILILAISVLLPACAKEEAPPTSTPETFNFRMCIHDIMKQGEQSYELSRNLTNLFYDRTDGRVKIDIYGQGEIYSSWRDAHMAVLAGELDFSYGGYTGWAG